jgi:hypothetical protein
MSHRNAGAPTLPIEVVPPAMHLTFLDFAVSTSWQDTM